MHQTSTLSRPDPVAVALANLSDARKPGTLFVGPVGSGKTFMLQAVVQGVSNSVKLSNRSEPIQLASCRDRDVDAALAENDLGLHGPKVLAVDNLETLPRRTLRLISTAIDEGKIQIVGTVRTGAADVVMGCLRPCRSPVLLELPPWDEGQLARHAVTALDGPLSRWSIHQLVHFAGGNPLCLVELLELGKISNQLDHRERVWVWRGEPVVPATTLARFSHSLRSVPAAARQALACLAVLGPITLTQLSKIVRGADLREAESIGLLSASIDVDGAVLLAASRPLEARVIVSHMALLQLRELCAEMVAKLLDPVAGSTADAVKSHQLVRIGELCRRTGVTVPVQLRLPLAAASLRHHDPETASWLLQDLAPAHEVFKLQRRGLLDRCRFAEAADLVRGQIEETARSPFTVEQASPSFGTEMTQGEVHQVRAVALDEMAGRASEPPTLNRSTSSWTLWADAWTGRRLEQARRTGERALADHDASADTNTERYQQQLTGTMAAALQTGRVEEALRYSRRPGQEVVSNFQPAFRLTWWTVVGLAHLARGAIPEAGRASKTLIGVGLTEQWPLAYSLGTLIAGRTALAEGTPEIAIHYLGESIAVTGRGSVSLGAQLALESLALAYAVTGDSAGADRLHQAADWDSVAAAPQYLQSLTAITRSESLYYMGHRHAALNLAERVSTAAHRSGQHLTALLGCFLASRWDASSARTSQVNLQASFADFELAQVNARHSMALESGQGNELAEIAANYADRGLKWLGAEAAAEALRTQTTTGGHPMWTTSARAHIAYVQGRGVVLPTWIEVYDRAVLLTAREQEIAESVIQGRTAAEVASDLYLSRRTVENHLQRVYRKLGISRRSELTTALAGSSVRTVQEARQGVHQTPWDEPVMI